jgi:hypothetical protein
MPLPQTTEPLRLQRLQSDFEVTVDHIVNAVARQWRLRINPGTPLPASQALSWPLCGVIECVAQRAFDGGAGGGRDAQRLLWCTHARLLATIQTQKRGFAHWL